MMQPQFPKLHAKLIDNGFYYTYCEDTDRDCYQLEKHLLMGCFSAYNTCYREAKQGFSNARLVIGFLESEVIVRIGEYTKKGDFSQLKNPTTLDFCQRFANCLAILARNEGMQLRAA